MKTLGSQDNNIERSFYFFGGGSGTLEFLLALSMIWNAEGDDARVNKWGEESELKNWRRRDAQSVIEGREERFGIGKREKNHNFYVGPSLFPKYLVC